MNNYKTFEDLEFKPHFAFGGLQARMDFENGYGISVIRFRTLFGGYGSYTDNEDEWEIAVFDNGDITYDTPITSDVIGHLKKDEVTEYMKRIQDLKRTQ